MKAIFIWAFISGIIFLSFVATFLYGLIKKKRKAKVISLILFLLMAGSGVWTVYLLASKSYNKVTSMLKPRTGEEIYTALFGNGNKCVKILHYQDQVVPKVDYAIWLHFETCPDELKRILQQDGFQMKKLSRNDEGATISGNNIDWFKPQSLGDSILVFIHDKDEYGNQKVIYTSLDSTRAFCMDIAN